MVTSPDDLYKAHVKNLRAVDTALSRIFRELNTSLARADNKTSDALLKVAMLLLGAWAENRLRKLLFEPNGFSQHERDRVGRANSQLEHWKAALELGFRKRYRLPHANLNVSLPLTPRFYYQTLASILEDDLKPIIEIRNKLAHGQWARTLNNENDDFSPEYMALIQGENAHSIKCKKRILEYLAQLIHDLLSTQYAFERDFDNHFRILENAKRDISARSYEKWLSDMQAKLERGRQARSG